MSTTTFQTKFNSVSHGCSKASLKQRISTCLERWRQNLTFTTEQRKHEYQQHHRAKSQEGTYNFHSHRWLDGSSIFCHNKLQKFIELQQQRADSNSKCNVTTRNDCKGPSRKYGCKVEIVAKLLSTTLIAKAKSSTETEDFSQQTDENLYRSFENQIQVIQSSTLSSTSDYYEEDAMTITDLTFLELREEYPDLNAEIRSILTARAQDGATISEIRDDYRKLTGLPFPIYEDITEFLLTIPHVTAYCSEKGTRIFNIRAMNKTKHIHDMVMHQKPQPEPIQRHTVNRCYYRERQRNTNYQSHAWRWNTNQRPQYNRSNIYVDTGHVRDTELHTQLIPSTDGNLSRDGSEGFFENNCYYQDNCNYLYNRICNKQLPPATQLIENPHMAQDPQTAPPPPTNVGNSLALNNLNTVVPSYKNNINHLNSVFQLEQPQYQQNVNNMASLETRRPSLNPYKPGIPPRSSRSSSPTAKSWYTNDSAYTDSDYEAHLLDFLLMGDDFLLYMARMELRCKFKKNQKILQSGLCVSGQTIGAALKRIRAMSDSRRSIIINIGSVDIMQGRQLIQIEHDFRELLLTMLKKGITPILTTLAPLANYSHNNSVKRMLERFNDFIQREGKHRNLMVIDVWKCLVNEKGQVFFDCYQSEPRNVTGTSEPYLFWNKIGRQRVLQLIESKLEY